MTQCGFIVAGGGKRGIRSCNANGKMGKDPIYCAPVNRRCRSPDLKSWEWTPQGRPPGYRLAVWYGDHDDDLESGRDVQTQGEGSVANTPE